MPWRYLEIALFPSSLGLHRLDPGISPDCSIQFHRVALKIYSSFNATSERIWFDVITRKIVTVVSGKGRNYYMIVGIDLIKDHIK